MVWLSKILKMTYNLEQREYIIIELKRVVNLHPMWNSEKVVSAWHPRVPVPSFDSGQWMAASFEVCVWTSALSSFNLGVYVLRLPCFASSVDQSARSYVLCSAWSGVVISVRTPSYFEPKKMMEGLSALNNVLNLHMLTKHAMPARQLSTKKNLPRMMH